MKALVVDNGSTFVKEIVGLLQSVGVDADVVSRDAFKSGEESKYDFLVLSGGHLANTNVMENLQIYEEEIKAIKNSETPILGICLGHQLIATIFGAEIYKMDNKVRGVFTITKACSHPILDSVKNFDVFETHRYGVKKISPALLSVAESENGVEILEVKGRKVVGFQFHPEMSQSETGGKQLIKNFIKFSWPN